MERRLSATIYLVCILLLAAALRFYRLDAQSFWNDEGNSARIAERTPALILAGAAGDIHPPGYYLLLHYWRALAGQSEFALRSLSVAAGTATVALTYALGRRLFGPTCGLLAALFSAVSPLAIYYAQEARMYALLGALSVASTYLLLRLLPPASCRLPLASYVLVSAAGLYTQYAFPFVLLVHNAIFLLWWIKASRRRRLLLMWGGIQATIVLLYLPWLPTALHSVAGWSSAGRGYGLGTALLETFRALSVGITMPADLSTAGLVGAGILLLWGMWPRREKRPDLASVGVYLLLPIALIFAFDLYKPAWLKFLLVVLPPFHILLGRGAEQIASCKLQIASCKLQVASCILLLASCILLLASCLASLRNLYFDPAYARDDYRRIAADVAAAARPDDAVILNAPNQWEVFTYYYPDRDVYPAPYRPETGEVEAFLAPIIARPRRLFALYWGDAEADPRRLVESALAERAYKAADRWYGRVRLSIYGIAALPKEPSLTPDARFGQSIWLKGCAFDVRAAPGDILPVTFFWEAEAAPGERYKVTVQLLDAAGQLAAQRDEEPRDDLLPTDRWPVGEVVIDRCGLLLPPDLPAGQYTLLAALYPVAGGERLPVTVNGEVRGDHLILGSTEVATP